MAWEFEKLLRSFVDGVHGLVLDVSGWYEKLQVFEVEVFRIRIIYAKLHHPHSQPISDSIVN